MTEAKLNELRDFFRGYRHYEDEEAAYDSELYAPFSLLVHLPAARPDFLTVDSYTDEEADELMAKVRDMESKLIQTRPLEDVFVNLWAGEPASMAGHELTDADYAPDTADFVPRMIPYLINDGSYHPAIIVVSGGTRANAVEGIPYCRYFNSIGLHAFQLVQRMGNQKWNYSLDLQRAIRCLRADADKYLIKKDKIGAIGSSMGGVVIVTYIENMDFDAKPSSYDPEYTDDAVDAESGKLDFYMGLYTSSHPFQPRPENAKYEQYPPVFLVYGGSDGGLKNQISYFNDILQNGVRAEAHLFDGMAHGVGLADGARRPNSPDGQISGPDRWPELAKLWLQRVIGLKY